MVYEVPRAKQSVDQDKFKFTVEGEDHSATRFDLLPTGFMESLSELKNSQVVKALRLAIAGDNEDLAAKLAELPLKHVQGLIEAWQEDSGVTLGESQASES